MEKVKVVVLRPWLDGQKAGDVITLNKIHPSLKTHVRLVNEPAAEKPIGGEQDKKPEGENPNPEGGAPKAETEAPKAETEAPKAETEAPKAETEAPKAETEAPKAESKKADKK